MRICMSHKPKVIIYYDKLPLNLNRQATCGEITDINWQLENGSSTIPFEERFGYFFGLSKGLTLASLPGTVSVSTFLGLSSSISSSAESSC